MQEFSDLLLELGFEVHDFTIEILAKEVLPLARKHRLTVYDSTYLALALRYRTALATFDKELGRAAAECGLPDAAELAKAY